MHELTLFAQIPHAKREHVARAVTAVTGMPAVPILEHHLLYKPKRHRQAVGGGPGVGSGNSGSAGASSTADFYYLKLVADIHDDPANKPPGNTAASEDAKVEKSDAMDTDQAEKPADDDVMEVDTESADKASDPMDKARRMLLLKTPEPTTYNVKSQKWTIRFTDLPEVPGKRPVTSRMIYNASIHEGDALAFVDSLGYTLVSEYIVTGHYFVYHNTYITLTRILLPPQPFVPFPLENCKSLDPADSSILQASIKVVSANEQETMNKGIEELKMLKGELKGVVDLEIGDRLSLDTRVR